MVMLAASYGYRLIETAARTPLEEYTVHEGDNRAGGALCVWKLVFPKLAANPVNPDCEVKRSLVPRLF
jgi:hypothetical protein